MEPAAVNDQAGNNDIDVRTIVVGGQPLLVATTRAREGRPPLLLFNGIGANWQIAKPFLQALTNTTAIIFDVPGISGSPLPSLPYRPSTLARLAARLIAQLGHQERFTASAACRLAI
jgi:pimeloyl-ACP methyl ester carboxylesterase